MDAIAAAIDRAKSRASAERKTYAVVLMDSGDGRAVRVCSDDYTYDAEFDAFDGRVLHLVHADGSVE